MDPFKVDRITGLALQVSNLESAAKFYVEGLGFRSTGRVQDHLGLRLGAQAIALEQNAVGAPRRDPANAIAFQHFAVVVSDMAAAHAHVMRLKPEAISNGGPQRLPASSGRVTAWKFRGPDGQPLELLETSDETWAEAARQASTPPFLGIDHTALGCADIRAGVAFYETLGFRRGPGSHNRGAEQDRLDGLEDVDLEIATLFTPSAGPHIELLHYRRPAALQTSPPPARITLTLAGDGVGPQHFLDADRHRIAVEDAAI